MACTSGCRTKDHASYAECLQSKNPRVAYCDSSSFRDATLEKQKDRDIDAYRAARAQGIQPRTSQRKDVDAAVAISDATGTAFQA